MTTAYVSHPDCMLHVTPGGHPEQSARLEAIEVALSGEEFSTLERIPAPKADPNDILRCHPAKYLNNFQTMQSDGRFGNLDADTYFSPGTFDAAFRAVGANVTAVNLVLSGQAKNAFVGCRPPGHHAEKSRSMGFCLFGNVAIAAKYALDHHGLDRVAIVDFDVHHGNGTQDLLWDEERCLFCSTHQMPLYPGSGAATETGTGNNIFNIPLEPESNGQLMRKTYERQVFPAIREFAPDLILISAGFDAHRRDPLANLNWETDDFAWLTRSICGLADELCGGRVVSTLEGGYDLQALGDSVAAHVKELMEAG